MEIYYWFKDPSESLIIVSPYYEGQTMDNFVKNFGKPLDYDTIIQIFG